MVLITQEQLEALAQAEDLCLRITDPKTNKQYVIFEEPRVPEASVEHIEYMRRGLVAAEEAIALGECSEWDKDAFLAEMRRGQEGA